MATSCASAGPTGLKLSPRHAPGSRMAAAGVGLPQPAADAGADRLRRLVQDRRGRLPRPLRRTAGRRRRRDPEARPAATDGRVAGAHGAGPLPGRLGAVLRGHRRARHAGRKRTRSCSANAEFRGLRGAARCWPAATRRPRPTSPRRSWPTIRPAPCGAATPPPSWATGRTPATSSQAGLRRPMTCSRRPWRARFARADAEAALALGDSTGAGTQIALALALRQPTPTKQLAARLVQARLIEAQGAPGQGAGASTTPSPRAPLEQLAAPAVLRATQIRLDQGKLTPAKAAETFDGLRYRWRGDATELEIIRAPGPALSQPGPLPRGAGGAALGRQAPARPAGGAAVAGRPRRRLPRPVPRRPGRRPAADPGAGPVLRLPRTDPGRAPTAT